MAQLGSARAVAAAALGRTSCYGGQKGEQIPSDPTADPQSERGHTGKGQQFGWRSPPFQPEPLVLGFQHISNLGAGELHLSV